MELAPVDNIYFKAYIEDGIFFIIYKTDQFTLDVGEQAVRIRLSMSKGTPIPMLSDVRSFRSATKEARKFITLPENNTLLTAGALLVGSDFQKVTGNLLVLFSKMPVPAKVFTDTNRAIEWLSQYKHGQAI